MQAALAQFEADNVSVERRPETRTREQIQNVVAEAHASGSMLVHTLASTELRREIYLRANERGIHSVDLLGTCYPTSAPTSVRPPVVFRAACTVSMKTITGGRMP